MRRAQERARQRRRQLRGAASNDKRQASNRHDIAPVHIVHQQWKGPSEIRQEEEAKDRERREMRRLGAHRLGHGTLPQIHKANAALA